MQILRSLRNCRDDDSTEGGIKKLNFGVRRTRAEISPDSSEINSKYLSWKLHSDIHYRSQEASVNALD